MFEAPSVVFVAFWITLLTDLLLTAAILAVAALLEAWRGTELPQLVLLRFELDPSSSRVDIRGRPAGVIAWLLRQTKFEGPVSLSAGPSCLRIERWGLRGEDQVTIPHPRVDAVLCGYRRPLWMAVFAAFYGFQAVLAMLLATGAFWSMPAWGVFGAPASSAVAHLIVAAGLLLWYARSAHLFLGLQVGVLVYGFRVYGSVLEGTHVRIEQMRAAAAMIQSAVLTAHGGEPGGAAAWQCPDCSAWIPGTAMFCETCGARRP